MSSVPLHCTWLKQQAKNKSVTNSVRSLGRSLKVWGKWSKLKPFQGLKCVEKLSGVCESLWILRFSERYGKTVSLSVRNCTSLDWTVVKKKKEKSARQNHRMRFLSVLTDRVCRPLATVRVAPLYQMCGRVACLHVAFLCHIANVCEFWKDFSVRTLDSLISCPVSETIQSCYSMLLSYFCANAVHSVRLILNSSSKVIMILMCFFFSDCYINMIWQKWWSWFG